MKDIFLSVITIIVSILAAWYTASYAFRVKLREGKIQILDIIIRYYLAVINSFDKNTKQISENSLDKTIYTHCIKTIWSDLRKLAINPYFNKLLEKNLKISRLIILLEREILINKTSRFFINSAIYNEFSEIFNHISQDLPKKYLSKNQFYQEMLEIKNSLDKGWKK